MDNIKDIVRQVFEKMVQGQAGPQDKLERIWLSILREGEEKHLKLLGLKNDTLFVDVDSPAWLFQMRIRKKKILEKFQEQIPEIKNISFKIGKVK